MDKKGIKFLEKNKETIKELDSFIENNDVNLIITSIELYYYFGEYVDDFEITRDDDVMVKFGKYKGKRVIGYPYTPANLFQFVLKKNKVRMNIPCVCGIYSDEKHP